MNERRYAMWLEQKAEALRIRRAAVRPPIADSLPKTLDVAVIRLALPRKPHSVTQDQFARRFGFSAAAVRDWEQGRRKPDAAARVLLALIAHDHAGLEFAILAATGAGDNGLGEANTVAGNLIKPHIRTATEPEKT